MVPVSAGSRRSRVFYWFMLFICIIPAGVSAQSDVLVLQKNGQNIISFVPGRPIMLQTIYDQWFDGYVTAVRNDSLFINDIPFHYKEIKAIRRERSKLNYVQDGTLLMIAGGGVVALNVINGLYRKDKAGQWFSTGGWIAAGALLGGGFLLRRAGIKSYQIGKKYQLHYLDLHNDNQVPTGPPEPGNR